MKRVDESRATRRACPGWLRGAALSGALALPAAAQEVTFFGGATNSIDAHLHVSEQTYAWKVEYRQGLGEHFEFSYAWLNEGHVSGHHRDGSALQLWARENVFDRRLSIAVGAGAFRYHDTAESRDGFDNVHDFAALLSADVAVYLGKRWILRGEVNRTLADSSSIDTWDFLLGLGYQLTPPDEVGPRAWPETQSEPATLHEITLFAGHVVLNSLDSPSAVAASLEYRRSLSRYFDVSAAFLYEGGSSVARRAGFIVQGWLVRVFLRDRLALSLGLGLHLAVNERRDETSDRSRVALAGEITPSVSYRFSKRWHVRFSWNRSVTNYDRDTEVHQLGVGYRF
jgi:hypothetical protein